MRSSKTAFTLIELLTVIGIIVILIALTTGAVRLVRNRAKIMTTQHTLNIITQALAHYKEAKGDFPQVFSAADQGSLMTELTTPVAITDYKGVLLKTVEAVFSTADVDALVQEGLVNAGRTVFLDAWENPILYFYSGGMPAASSISDHPYPSRCVADGSFTRNVNWNARNADLISTGPDGLSAEGDGTQKDDLTNFT